MVINLWHCPILIFQRQKPVDSIKPDYQDTEDPEYEDFRAEASLQRHRQLESFCKAEEAFKQGRKEVASFYAQQVKMCGFGKLAVLELMSFSGFLFVSFEGAALKFYSAHWEFDLYLTLL